MPGQGEPGWREPRETCGSIRGDFIEDRAFAGSQKMSRRSPGEQSGAPDFTRGTSPCQGLRKHLLNGRDHRTAARTSKRASGKDFQQT